MDRPVAAAFDLDGTVTRRDTFLGFLRFVAGDARYVLGMAALTPELLAYAAGRATNTAVKEALVGRFLAGLDDTLLVEAAERFADHVVATDLRPEALRRLRWHLDAGHPTAFVSASLDLWVAPIGRRLGVAQVFASRLDRAGGRVRVDNCVGPAKVARLREAWGDPAAFELHAYGDSDGDRELLAAATFPWFRSFGGTT